MTIHNKPRVIRKCRICHADKGGTEFGWDSTMGQCHRVCKSCRKLKRKAGRVGATAWCSRCRDRRRMSDFITRVIGGTVRHDHCRECRMESAQERASQVDETPRAWCKLCRLSFPADGQRLCEHCRRA